jgi:hypothetical protein
MMHVQGTEPGGTVVNPNLVSAAGEPVTVLDVLIHDLTKEFEDKLGVILCN